MTVDSGFDELQTNVNVPPDELATARDRRNLFQTALGSEADVDEVRPSGSLARGTHKDPIHDVDLVVVYDASDHPGWGAPGASALGALEHCRTQVNAKLGSSGSGDVRHTLIRNHSVKCFLDDPGDPNAFTVDVTPGLVRSAGGFLIPEKLSQDWIASDPQFLIDAVAKRHAEWNEFAKLVRVIKRWNSDHGGFMKSLTVEVLALAHLPATDRPVALARFFTAAQVAVWSPITDPAGLCGEIQPDLDRSAASDALAKAAEVAARAVEASARNESRRAQCLWNQVFGDIYPEPYLGCGDLAVAGGTATAAVPKRPVVDSPQGGK
jgi:hypothetical protein